MPIKAKRSAVATPHSNDNRNADALQGTMHQKVMQVLLDNPKARSSDKVLISEVYSRFYDVCNEPFWIVMEEMTGLPSFETITRCRRKIQEEYEELRAVEPVEKERIAKQMDFIDYARGEAYV